MGLLLLMTAFAGVDYEWQVPEIYLLISPLLASVVHSPLVGPDEILFNLFTSVRNIFTLN